MERSIEVTEQSRVALDTSVSDATFLDENTLLIIDEEANLWHHSLTSGVTTQYASRADVLSDSVFREQLRSRIFPRLAAHQPTGQVVVNTEDAVLVSRNAEGAWRTMIESRGLYDPPLDFSPAGDAFVMLAESVLLVWNAGSLPEPITSGPTERRDQTRHHAKPTFELQGIEAFTWSIDGQRLIILRDDGRLQSVEPLRGETPSEAGQITYADESAAYLGKYALSFLDGNTLLISLEACSLDFWRIDPFGLITRVPLEDVAHSVTVDRKHSWFALESERGLEFWDIKTLTAISALTKPARRWDGLRFSPERSRMLSIGEPAASGVTESLLNQPKVDVTVWRISAT